MARKKTAGQRLKEWREKRFPGKITQSQTRAALALGYTLGMYRKLESDQGKPSTGRVFGVEDATGIDGLAALFYPEMGK